AHAHAHTGTGAHVGTAAVVEKEKTVQTKSTGDGGLGWLWFLLGLVVLGLLIWWIVSKTQRAPSGSTGTVVVGLAATAAGLGNVSKAEITVDKIEAHRSDGRDDQGWVVISSTPHTVDLVALRNNRDTVLLGRVSLPVGQYNGIRLHVSRFTITDTNGNTRNVRLPSSEI